MSTVYRLWCLSNVVEGGGRGFWSNTYRETFLDRKSAQKACNKANVAARGVHDNECLYEVAKDNGDNGPSFFDVNDPEPVSSIPPSSEDCWPPFSNPQPGTDEVPDTQRSSEAAPSFGPVSYRIFDMRVSPPVEVPQSEPAPDAKRFVTIEDLRDAVNAVTDYKFLEWRVGQVNVCSTSHLKGNIKGNIFINGVLITKEQAIAIATILCDAAA